MIDAYHDTDKTETGASTDDTNIQAFQQSNPCPITLIPPLLPVTSQSTVVSRPHPITDPNDAVLVTNTLPIQHPGFPPRGYVPVTRPQKPWIEPPLTVDGGLTSDCQLAKPTKPLERWMLASRLFAPSTSAVQEAAKSPGSDGKSPVLE